MELTSIGTLVAYTKVTISVLVSRYQTGVQSVPEDDRRKNNITEWLQKLLSNVKGNAHKGQPQVAYQPISSEEDSQGSSNSTNSSRSGVTEGTASRAELAVFCLVVCITGLAVTFTRSFHDIINGKWWAIFLVCFFSGSTIVSLVAIQLQPQNSAKFPFMVRCVPYIPALTILINVVLLANLNRMTYVRFGVWMTIGRFRTACYFLFLLSTKLKKNSPF